jgi:chemotaxis protein MotB
MGKKQKCPECPKCLPGWLAQFGDLMSLLLVFFVLLLSMAVMDKNKVEEYFQIMKKSMGFMELNNDIREQTASLSDKQSKDSGGQMDGTDSDMETVVEEIEEIVQQQSELAENEFDKIHVSKGNNEFTLDIPSVLVFKEGEYEITQRSAKLFIRKIARVIRTMPQSFDIEVVGHSGTNRSRGSSIPRDGWDISALRAIAVVKEFIKNKIEPSSLKASAFSSFRPRSDTISDNRRVEIKFYSKEVSNDLFEEENFFDRIE